MKKGIFFILVAIFMAVGFYIGNYSSSLFIFAGISQNLKYGLIGLAVLLGLVAGIILTPVIIRGVVWATGRIEQYLQKTPIQDLLMGSIGLIVGLIIANLLGSILSSIGLLGKVIWIIGTLFLSYLGLKIGVKKREEMLSFFGNFPRLNKERVGRGDGRTRQNKILDTSVIIDGRIADLCDSGFIEGTLIVPAFVVEELRHIADSSDLLRRSKGRRGLDILNKMRKDLELKVQIYDNNRGLEDIVEVDPKLVKLAQKLSAKIITNDYNLNKVAELHGVKVLNINELANAVKPLVLPGEEIKIQVVKDGKESGQGIAYLDDGTMIVVDGGKRFIGQNINVVVTSVLQTAAGRMIFARPRLGERREEQPEPPQMGEVRVVG